MSCRHTPLTGIEQVKLCFLLPPHLALILPLISPSTQQCWHTTFWSEWLGSWSGFVLVYANSAAVWTIPIPLPVLCQNRQFLNGVSLGKTKNSQSGSLHRKRQVTGLLSVPPLTSHWLCEGKYSHFPAVSASSPHPIFQKPPPGRCISGHIVPRWDNKAGCSSSTVASCTFCVSFIALTSSFPFLSLLTFIMYCHTVWPFWFIHLSQFLCASYCVYES